MYLRPSIRLELDRQRQDELMAEAARRRVAKAAVRARASALISTLERRFHRMSVRSTHFGHRESGGIVVDLFWDPDAESEFRVEVLDRCDGACFVLHPATGTAAIDAFYHPFSTTQLPGYARAA